MCTRNRGRGQARRVREPYSVAAIAKHGTERPPRGRVRRQDLMTDDAEKSRKFYEQLFGWTFERTDRLGRPYFIARAGSAAVGGDDTGRTPATRRTRRAVDQLSVGFQRRQRRRSAGRALRSRWVRAEAESTTGWAVGVVGRLLWRTASRRGSSSRARSTGTSAASRQADRRGQSRSCSTS